jgi:hypothetical protein
MHYPPLAIRDRLVLFMAMSLSILFGVIGCGGGGGPTIAKPEGTYNTGYFIDSPVEGLQYTTPTWSGLTDSQGTFYYQDGEEITFSLGTVVLGQTLAKGIITPVDLDSTNPTTSSTKVINIARLLITLDQDGNPDNGITITQSVRDALNGINIDLTNPNIDSSAGIQEMFTRLNGLGIYSEEVTELVPADVAQNHLENTLSQIATEEVTAEEASNNMPLKATIINGLPYSNSSVIMIQGQSLNLQGSGSGGKPPYTYSWQINNEKPFSSNQDPGNHTFSTQGSYILTLTVTDSTGDSKIDVCHITVFGPETQASPLPNDNFPIVSMISPSGGATFNVGSTVNFQATIYNGNVPLYYAWSPGSSGNSSIPQNENVVCVSPRTYLITQSILLSVPGTYEDIVMAVKDTGIDGKTPNKAAASVEINVK